MGGGTLGGSAPPPDLGFMEYMSTFINFTTKSDALY